MLDNVITSDLRGQGADDFGKSKAMSVIDMTENLRRNNSSKGGLYVLLTFLVSLSQFILKTKQYRNLSIVLHE